MNPILWSPVFLLAALPTLASAEGRRVHPMPSDTDAQMIVLPVAVDNVEPRSAISLRESLRRPYEGAVEDQPFRLSEQERQRMRDQLRSQATGRPGKR